MSKLGEDSDMTVATGSAKNLVKGLSLIDLVASGPPMRQGELIEASGLPRASAIRILNVLCAADVLRNMDGLYEPGPHLAAWGHAFLGRLDLPGQATDVMERLVNVTGETALLGIRDGNSVLYIAVVFTAHAVAPNASIGLRNPLHCTGIGKALLAPLSREERAALLTSPLDRRTVNSITDLTELNDHLDASRERGYTVDDVENEEGVRCIAAPVLGHSGSVVAALSVAAPAYRFTTADFARLAPDVMAAAGELSVRLGYREALLCSHNDEE